MRLTLTFAVLCGLCGYAFANDGPYRFAPGDTLDITVWQDPTLNRQMVVAPDGTISFPLVGRIQAGGRTSETVSQALKKGLQPRFTTDLEVNVGLASRYVPREDELIPRYVYVTGEVARPGAFDIKTRTTVLQAIALSGGLGPFAREEAHTGIAHRGRPGGRPDLQLQGCRGWPGSYG